MKIVELLIIENTVKSLVKNEVIFTENELVEINHFKNNNELRLFLIDNFKLSNSDGVPDSKGMFSSKDNLSYYYDKENLSGNYMVYNN